MSTILKSLRKLEEEKSLLEKQINLKELIIREDPAQARENREPDTGKPRQWWMGLALIGAGLCLAGGVVVLMRPAPVPKQAEARTLQPTIPETSLAAASVQASSQGVPLSSIPDFTRRPERPDAGVIEEDDLPVPDPVPGSMGEGPLATGMDPEPAQPAAEEEIVAALQSVPKQTRATLTPAPRGPVIREMNPAPEIPGLKIKGIIFFGEHNADNYLFFTLPGSGIHKLKVGERVMEAKLTAIHPGRALFDYEGRPIEMRVGN